MEAGREYLVMGRMTFVDLAGSERLKTTQSTGKVLHEAGFINRSLYVLGKVIAGLVRTGGDLNHRDVPYRDSKLTKLLIGSLGGRTRTLLMACVTEASGSQAETLRTLKFSMSCARIRNRPVRFLDPQVKLILELRGEIKRLKDENSQLRTSIQTIPSDLPSSYIEDGEEMLKDNPDNEEFNNDNNDDDNYDEVMYNNNDNNSYKNGHYQEHSESYNNYNHRQPLNSNSCPQDRAITQPQNKGGGSIIREGINRKSQSLAELRADASAYAYNQDGEQDNEDMNYYPHPHSNKKSPNQKTNVLKKQYNRNIEISSDKRKSQTKFTSRVGGLKPFKKGSEVTSYELGTPMSDLRSAILMAKKKKWIGSGGKLDDFNEDFMSHDDNQERGMDVHNVEALHHHHHNNYYHDNRHMPLKQTPTMSSEGDGGMSQPHGGYRVASNDTRGNVHGQYQYSGNEIGPSSSSPAPSSNSPQPHNDANSNRRIHESASNSGSGSNRIGAAAMVASSEPYVSGMTR